MHKPTAPIRIADYCHRLGWTFVDWLIVLSCIAFLIVFICGGLR